MTVWWKLINNLSFAHTNKCKLLRKHFTFSTKLKSQASYKSICLIVFTTFFTKCALRPRVLRDWVSILCREIDNKYIEKHWNKVMIQKSFKCATCSDIWPNKRLAWYLNLYLIKKWHWYIIQSEYLIMYMWQSSSQPWLDNPKFNSIKSGVIKIMVPYQGNGIILIYFCTNIPYNYNCHISWNL